MDNWEKTKTISSAVATVFIPVVLLVISNQFSAALKDRELEGKFVELSVSILREAPSEETRNLRDWATQVINKYSGVPLSSKTKEDLIERTPILPPQRKEYSITLYRVSNDGKNFANVVDSEVDKARDNLTRQGYNVFTGGWVKLESFFPDGMERDILYIIPGPDTESIQEVFKEDILNSFSRKKKIFFKPIEDFSSGQWPEHLSTVAPSTFRLLIKGI